MNDRCLSDDSSADRTETVDRSRISRSRRSLLSLLGATAGSVSVAGCVGGEEKRIVEDDDSSRVTDGDGTTESDADDETDSGDDSVDYPDFVVESDLLYGRTELRPAKGVVVVDIRPDYLSDDAEPTEIAMIESETGDVILDGGTYSSDTIEIPISSWASRTWNETLTTEIEIQVRNDFGDVLASTTWDLTPDVEITDIGVVHEYAADRTSGDPHGDIYIEIENNKDVPVKISHVSLPDVYGTTLNIDDEELTSLDSAADHALLKEADYTSPAVAGGGTTRVVSTNSPLERRTYTRGSPDGMDCGVVYQSAVQLAIGGTETSYTRPISVNAGSEYEHDTDTGTYHHHQCVQTTIELE